MRSGWLILAAAYHLNLTDLLDWTCAAAAVLLPLYPGRCSVPVPREDNGAEDMGDGRGQAVAQRLAHPLCDFAR